MLRASAPLLIVAAVAGCSDAGPEPGEHLPGGDTTNKLLLGIHAFSSPAANMPFEHEGAFFTGNSLFNQPWVEAPSSTSARDGLGPTFNARACDACHQRDGRAAPVDDDGNAGIGLLFRLSVLEDGVASPVPNYGSQLQPLALDGVPAEGRVAVTYETVTGVYQDGSTWEILRPRYTVTELNYGPLPPGHVISPRIAPIMIGLGLLEAIPAQRLADLADENDDDRDGISGRVHYVAENVVGRFGWKSEEPTVRSQTAGAFLGDIGVTTTLNPTDNCPAVQLACRNAGSGGEPELPDFRLDFVEAYASLLAPPIRSRHLQDQVLQGKQVFREIGCDGCHTPSHVTGNHGKFDELSSQLIWPYTDLLLHDMGADLADNRPVKQASGREWRTPPLWGMSYLKTVSGHTRLMHDGRARNVEEAILWHAGEAQSHRDAFTQLGADARAALITFVESL